MKPANLLFILSDQHQRDVTGCYGHPFIHTPHLDRLAQRGTRFTNAITNCPLCVPVRASLATGRYVHEIGCWDNGHPYDGRVHGWGHALKQQGFRCDSIGKLHFRSSDDDNGFTEEIEPLHVVDGVGDVLGCIRDNAVFRQKRGGILEAGPGESTYQQYDARNGANAVQWVRQHAEDEKPWVLFLSFVCPHPPYISPPDTSDLYSNEKVVLPPQWQEPDWPPHPAMDYFRRYFGFTPQFSEEQIRQLNAAYCGVTTYLDRKMGEVLAALSDCGLDDRTRIIYTSDHGESLGARGIFGKFTMYEESAAIPFLMAGPGVPAGHVVDTPVSLVDCYQTILEAVGAEMPRESADLPGESLWPLAAGAEEKDRTVFSEYHAAASENAFYMLRNRRHKYVHYVGAEPQLFDLATDPQELHDLAGDVEQRPLLEAFEKQLRDIVNPEAADSRAKADQKKRVEECGGEAVVRARGTFDNSPVPGEAPKFRDYG